MPCGAAMPVLFVLFPGFGVGFICFYSFNIFLTAFPEIEVCLCVEAGYILLYFVYI